MSSRVQPFALTLLSVMTAVAMAQNLPQAAGAPDTPAHADNLTAAIEKAASPSEATAVYAQAQEAAPNSPTVAATYVRRMVQLGAPLLAESQARAVTEHDRRNGLAWAVLGLASLTRDDTTTAAEQLVQAARYAPENEFVQITAGQFVAWYDTRSRELVPTPAERRAVTQIRTALRGRTAYLEAYRDAKLAYSRKDAANADTDPAPAQAPEPAQVDVANPVMDVTTVYTDQSYCGTRCGRYICGYPYVGFDHLFYAAWGYPLYVNYGYPYYVNYGYPTYINYGYPYPGDGGRAGRWSPYGSDTRGVLGGRDGQPRTTWQRIGPNRLTPPGHPNAASSNAAAKSGTHDRRSTTPQARPPTTGKPAQPPAAKPAVQPGVKTRQAPAAKPAPAQAPTPTKSWSGSGTKR